MEVFSAITSTVLSVLIFVLWNEDLTGLLSSNTFFWSLRTMNQVRPFKLVFLVQFLRATYWEERPKVDAILASVNTKGLLNFLNSPPIVCMYTCLNNL